MDDARSRITGTSAAEIADSVRGLCERGELVVGTVLPPVREIAARLGVNRNTAVAAYQQLAQAGIVVSRGRAGTVVAGHDAVASEGSAVTGLRDVGTGNPDPRFIPDPAAGLQAVGAQAVLYGGPVIDPELERWAQQWLAADLPDIPFRVTVTSGAVDAVERLLAQALLRDDAVALEAPCFLASIHTVRLGGYRAVPVAVDEEGMTVAGLRAAVASGIRALICTPRAQNPTGVSLSARRAAELREVLSEHPYLLVIEDDHFSLLSQHPYRSIIGPAHQRFALVRSVSKFLGPDMCLAVTATDPATAEKLAMRLSPGTTWVSHLLQRLTHAQLSNPAVAARIAAAGRHYAERNRSFAQRLTERGVPTSAGDGLSLWVRLPLPAHLIAERLAERGWRVRTGDDFALDAQSEPSRHLRLTVHDLTDPEQDRLLRDVTAALE